MPGLWRCHRLEREARAAAREELSFKFADGSVIRLADGKEQIQVIDDAQETLRHTAIINMRSAGVEKGTTMAISGHQTRSVFDRYGIQPENTLIEAGKLPKDPRRMRAVQSARKKKTPPESM